MESCLLADVSRMMAQNAQKRMEAMVYVTGNYCMYTDIKLRCAEDVVAVTKPCPQGSEDSYLKVFGAQRPHNTAPLGDFEP